MHYEIIVIHDNSTDLTARIAPVKEVRVEKEARKGYVHAFRKGIEVSQADIIAFTDADCRVPPDWAAKILENFSNSAETIEKSLDRYCFMVTTSKESMPVA